MPVLVALPADPVLGHPEQGVPARLWRRRQTETGWVYLVVLPSYRTSAPQLPGVSSLLRQHGLPVLNARNTAMIGAVTMLPPIVVADLFGSQPLPQRRRGPGTPTTLDPLPHRPSVTDAATPSPPYCTGQLAAPGPGEMCTVMIRWQVSVPEPR